MGLSTTYTKTETDFLIQQLEKKSEALYTDDTLAGDIIKRVDINTGENVNYRKTTTWYDGSAMNDSKVDGFMYKKIKDDYFLNTVLNQKIPLNAVHFGVKADGVTNDTINLQKAIDFGIKADIEIKIPEGVMIISSIVIDFNKNPNIRDFKFTGYGVERSKFLNTDESAVVVDIKGINNFQFARVGNFSVHRPDSETPTGGIGVSYKKSVYVALEDIDVFRFNQGFEFQDVALGELNRVNARWCGKGFEGKMANDGFTPPNLIAFNNCGFHSCTNTALKLENCHSVKFDSCGFEGNDADALDITFSGTNGGVGVTLINNYFEGNGGEFDVRISSYNKGIHNFIGNTFNRIAESKHTVYNILFEANVNTDQSLIMIGNSFFEAGNYVPSQNRPHWKVAWNPKAVNVVDHNNSFTPQYINRVDYKSYSGTITALQKESITVRPDGTFIDNLTTGVTASKFDSGTFLITSINDISNIKTLSISPRIGDAAILNFPIFAWALLNANTLQILTRVNGAADINADFNVVFEY